MEKKAYVAPAVSVCEVETTAMMAASLSRYEEPAQVDLDVLANKNEFGDIWGN